MSPRPEEMAELAQALDMARPKVEAYHAHLDQCAQCRNNPFNLCPEGARLLHAAVPGRPLK